MLFHANDFTPCRFLKAVIWAKWIVSVSAKPVLTPTIGTGCTAERGGHTTQLRRLLFRRNWCRQKLREQNLAKQINYRFCHQSKLQLLVLCIAHAQKCLASKFQAMFQNGEFDVHGGVKLTDYAPKTDPPSTRSNSPSSQNTILKNGVQNNANNCLPWMLLFVLAIIIAIFLAYFVSAVVPQSV